MSTQTIAAIATGLTNSGISIIRISGNKSLEIIGKIFKSSSKLEPNKIVYGKIYDGEVYLDNVLVSYFKAPRSFTGEDICEINCHGGIQITKEILELVLKNGAILAEPGEFSKRAFLNGKMDLSQAEAVINLINAKTKTSAKIATNQLDGALSNKIKEIREDLIELLAHIEVSIDYPEYDYEEVDTTNVMSLLDKKIAYIKNIINTYEQGKYIKDGVNVAILGKPNVGKSSLLNALANYEKAIVTDIPGTTRDIVEETINIGNIVLNVFDTAGIRDTEDIVEKIGVEKSIKMLDKVDLVIYIFNAEEQIQKTDLELLSKIQNKGIKFVTVINKMDKVQKTIFDTFLKEFKQTTNIEPISMSIINNSGIEELKKDIESMFLNSDFDYQHELVITNARHKNLLSQSIEYLNEAKREIENGNPIDIISIYVKKASASLGQIIGSDINADVVNKIFEKFCLGK